MGLFLGELGGCAFVGSCVHGSDSNQREVRRRPASDILVCIVQMDNWDIFFLECKLVSFVQQTALACFCFFGVLYSRFCFLGQGFCLFVLRQRSEICGQIFFSRGAYVACQDSLRWVLHAETAKINVSVEIREIQCFQTPHTPTPFTFIPLMAFGVV